METMEHPASTSLKASLAFIKEAHAQLCESDYRDFIRSICSLGHLSPYSFREKIKFCFRHRRRLIPELNPLLPDRYQFSQEEMRKEARDYRQLELYKNSIKFMNELKRKVRCPETLRRFHELVKSRKLNEFDAPEFYGRANKLLRGNFWLLKKMSAVLGDEMDPSYIWGPMPETSSSGDGVLNTTLRINNTAGKKLLLSDPGHLYRVEKLVEECLGPAPLEHESAWREEKRFELDVLHDKLQCAEMELRRVAHLMMNDAGAVREHLSCERVKRTLMPVERMLRKMEDLMSAPLQNVPIILDQLREKKEQVARALAQFSDKH